MSWIDSFQSYVQNAKQGSWNLIPWERLLRSLAVTVSNLEEKSRCRNAVRSLAVAVPLG